MNKNFTPCHIPPGNPGNSHTINIGISAWKAHQKHGDYEGECKLSTNSNVQETSKGKKK